MHTMHLLPGLAIQPNVELKTQPKQLLSFLPLVIALPGASEVSQIYPYLTKVSVRKISAFKWKNLMI